MVANSHYQINQEEIETEHIIGHTLARRTGNNVVNTMFESHLISFEDFIIESTEHKWLIILITLHPFSPKNGLGKINPWKQRPCVLYRGKFLTKLWCCIAGGKYNKIIWFYQLG